MKLIMVSNDDFESEDGKISFSPDFFGVYGEGVNTVLIERIEHSTSGVSVREIMPSEDDTQVLETYLKLDQQKSLSILFKIKKD